MSTGKGYRMRVCVEGHELCFAHPAMPGFEGGPVDSAETTAAVARKTDDLISGLISVYFHESGRLPRVGERTILLAGMASMLSEAVQRAYGWSSEEAAEFIGERIADIAIGKG